MCLHHGFKRHHLHWREWVRSTLEHTRALSRRHNTVTAFQRYIATCIHIVPSLHTYCSILTYVQFHPYIRTVPSLHTYCSILTYVLFHPYIHTVPSLHTYSSIVKYVLLHNYIQYILFHRHYILFHHPVILFHRHKWTVPLLNTCCPIVTQTDRSVVKYVSSHRHANGPFRC